MYTYIHMYVCIHMYVYIYIYIYILCCTPGRSAPQRRCSAVFSVMEDLKQMYYHLCMCMLYVCIRIYVFSVVYREIYNSIN